MNIKKEKVLIIIQLKKEIIEQKINQEEEGNSINIAALEEEKKQPKEVQEVRAPGVKIQKLLREILKIIMMMIIILKMH